MLSKKIFQIAGFSFHNPRPMWYYGGTLRTEWRLRFIYLSAFVGPLAPLKEKQIWDALKIELRDYWGIFPIPNSPPGKNSQKIP